MSILFVVLISLMSSMAEAARSTCDRVHASQSASSTVGNATRLIGPGQFRLAAAEHFVLVNPERFRDRRGVSMVESSVRLALEQRLKKFLDPDVAEFIAVLLIRTNTVIAETALIDGSLKLGRLYIGGQRVEDILQKWLGFVAHQQTQSGSLDIAQRALLREIDALIGPVQKNNEPEGSSQKKDREIAAAADSSQAINPFLHGNSGLKEKVRDILQKAINRVAHPFEAARNIADELVQSGKVQVRVVRSESRVDQFDVVDVFVGNWRLDLFLQELQKDIQKNGVQKYLQRNFEEDRRTFLGPTSRLISSIYERGRSKD